MHALSKSTVALVDEANRLAHERAWPWKKAALAERIADRVVRVGETGEWLAIPRIISLTLDDRRVVAEAAGNAARSLAKAVPVRHVARFDRAFRELSPYLHGEYGPWHDLDPRDLRKLASLEAGATLLQLAMCHPSGYVRQEAIRRAATRSDGSEIPFLLIRSNDWVAPVQKAAHDALRARLRPESLGDLVAAIPLLDRMRRWGRIRDDRLVEDIDRLLQTETAVEHLLEGTRSPDQFLRRGCFRRALESRHITAQEVLDRALADRDPAILNWASRRLCEADADVFVQFSERLLRDSLGSIRFAAARRLEKLGRSLQWQRFVLDPHAGLRNRAQVQARREGIDCARYYREALQTATGARLGAAIVGLGETGTGDDIDRIAPLLQHPMPRVRRSALRGLANLKDTGIIPRCLFALADPRPSVTHTARDILIRAEDHVAPSKVWDAFQAAPTPHGKKDALAVLATLDHWEHLPFALRATDAQDRAVREHAARTISRWLARQTRVFTTPSAAIADEIRARVARAQLPEAQKRELLEVVRTRT